MHAEKDIICYDEGRELATRVNPSTHLIPTSSRIPYWSTGGQSHENEMDEIECGEIE